MIHSTTEHAVKVDPMKMFVRRSTARPNRVDWKHMKACIKAVHIVVAVVAVGLTFTATPGNAKQTNDKAEHWGKWEALSNGFVGRRKVPANVDQPITQRRQDNVTERSDHVTRLQQIYSEQLQQQGSSGGPGNGFGSASNGPKRSSEYRGVRSHYKGDRTGYGEYHQGDGSNTAGSGIGFNQSSGQGQGSQTGTGVNSGYGRGSGHGHQDQSPSDAVWLKTGAKGLYAVSIAEVAAELNQDEGSIRNAAEHGALAMTNAGQPISWYFDRSADQVVFAGELYDTFYTDQNAYHLVVRGGKDAQPMSTTHGRPTRVQGSEAPFPETLHFEEEPVLDYATWSVGSEQDADYWFWDYLYGGYKDLIEVPLVIPNPTSSGQAELRVHLRGWTDLLPGNDHQVYAELNGTRIGSVVTWDGFDKADLVADFDQSLLDPSGNNTLSLHTVYAAGTHPGEWLDSVDLNYSREPVAHEGMVWLHDVAKGVQAVTGFATQDIVVIESPAGQAVLREDARVDPDGAGGYMVTFDTGDGGIDYLVAERDTTDTPLVEIDEPSDLNSGRNVADYLIIAPRVFEGTAEALAKYRENRFGNVKIAWLDDIYDEFSYGREDPFAITRFMAAVQEKWRVVPAYVVLIGKGTIDNKDRQGYSDSFLPVVMTSTPWALAASDERLVSDTQPGLLAIGRIPITNDDAGAGLRGQADRLRVQPAR